MYRTELAVKSLSVSTWLEQYRVLDAPSTLCKSCPAYGKVWSCPPGVPQAETYLTGYETVFVLGVKVIYSERAHAAADTPEHTEAVRRETYGAVKRTVLEALLALEDAFPGSRTIAAGRCELCPVCTREEGWPCRYPAQMRYSFSAFGLRLEKMSAELLEMPLRWAKEGLPAYNVALSALLTNHPVERHTVERGLDALV